MFNFLTGMLSVFVLFSSLFFNSNSIINIKTLQYQGSELKDIVLKMPIEEKVGQMLITEIGGQAVDDNAAEKIKTYHLGGIILYSFNTVNTEQTVKLTDQLQKASGNNPLLITIDQEGGRVSRIQSGTSMPGNMALGAVNSEEEAKKVGNTIGKELKALGINVNLAPVIDVLSNPDNPLGLRSFGSDPYRVADMGVSYIKGLHASGVASAVKHFPGLGDTHTDSHLGLDSVPYSFERLKNVELMPFQKAFDNGVDMLMTAHVTFPGIDDTKVLSKKINKEIYLPATLSHKILTGLVRDKMGYKGVIVTDSLQMNAIQDNYGNQMETAVMAINAGADMLIVSGDLRKICDRLIKAVKNGEIPEERINESVQRIYGLKLSKGIIKIVNGQIARGDWSAKSLDEELVEARLVVGCSQHKALEQSVADKSITLIKNESNTLPFKLEREKKIVWFTPTASMCSTLKASIEDFLSSDSALSSIVQEGFVYDKLYNLDAQQKLSVDSADYVIIATSGYQLKSLKGINSYWWSSFPNDLIKYTNSSGKPLVVLSTGMPYDISYIQGAKSYIAVYGSSKVNILSGIKTVFGKVQPSGKLPVSIPGLSGSQALYDVGFGLSYNIDD